LANFEMTLLLLRSLLLPDGLFVQWDWLVSEGESEHGLTREQVATAYQRAGLEMVSFSSPFSVEGAEGDMRVLMGVGKNA
jgi:hypothetical protein